MAGTTPKARALGAEIKAARKHADVGVRELGRRLGMSHSVISRIESGERSVKPEDVAAILGALGVNGADRDRIVELARDTSGSHWLGIGMPEQQMQLNALLDFERIATRVVDVAPLLMPGLIQTPDYVRAIMSGGGIPDSEVETRVNTRLGRRQAIERRNPVNVLALIGEPALWQDIGGREVRLDQLRQVLKLGELPNVDVRIVPNRAGWNPILEGPFTLLDFHALPTIVHLEHRHSGLFLHEEPDVKAYREAVDRVCQAAMSPEESARLIANAINGSETTT